MKFRYKGRGPDGKLVAATLEAPTRTEALAQLQQSGMLVSSLEADSKGLALDFNVNLGRLRSGSKKITSGDLATFCSQFATLIAAGVPLLQTMELLAQQFKAKRLATVISAVANSVQAGSSLSQAMQPYRGQLPDAMIYITAVAEMTGQLEQGYRLLSAQFEQEDDVARKVRSAMSYPAVILIVATGVIIFMLTYVLPNYTSMFKSMGAELPAATKTLISLGDFVRYRGWLLIPVPFLLGWGWRRALRNYSFRAVYQRMLLRTPVIGQVVYKRELGRLTRTLSTMIGSGVPLLSGLGMVREALAFIPIADALSKVSELVRAGHSLGSALKRQRVFDNISVEMISLGEASGNLEAMLVRVADLADKDLATLLDRATALMEPALTVVLAIVVVGIIVPILLPMFDIFRQVH